MSPARPSRRRRLVAWALALPALLAVPAVGQDLGGPAGSDWRDAAGLSPTARRRIAARLAQRERDAERRRDAARRRGSNRYSFGRIDDPAANRAVPRAALETPDSRTTGTRANGPRTAVEVAVLVDGSAGVLRVRGWREAFADLGVPVQIRTGSRSDEPGVTETAVAGLRTVRAVGVLTPSGGLAFGETRFAPGDAPELAAWVRDLSEYGAAGSPAGQPLWGLSRPAFAAVFAALSEPAPAGFAAAGGGTAGAAISALELPGTLPVRLDPAAEAVLAAPHASAAPGGPLPALSKGTALAVLLARRGLAFRPTRRADGKVELTVVPRPDVDPAVPAPGTAAEAAARATGDAADAPPPVWPVGWDLPGGPDRARAAGTLFALSDVGVAGAPLAAFAATAGRAAGVPVVLDSQSLLAAGVDPQAAMTAVPRGRGTWAKALRYALAEHRLVGRLRRDEAGNGFLWVVPARRR